MVVKQLAMSLDVCSQTEIRQKSPMPLSDFGRAQNKAEIARRSVHACPAQSAVFLRHAVNAQDYILYTSTAASQNTHMSQSVDQAESKARLAVCAE